MPHIKKWHITSDKYNLNLYLYLFQKAVKNWIKERFDYTDV